jgi:hypothetical protein
LHTAFRHRLWSRPTRSDWLPLQSIPVRRWLQRACSFGSNWRSSRYVRSNNSRSARKKEWQRAIEAPDSSGAIHSRRMGWLNVVLTSTAGTPRPLHLGRCGPPDAKHHGAEGAVPGSASDSRDAAVRRVSHSDPPKRLVSRPRGNGRVESARRKNARPSRIFENISLNHATRWGGNCVLWHWIAA